MSEEPKKKGAVPIWRRVGRGFFIGRGVRVTVIECEDEAVRLGIEAPLGIVVSPPAVDFEEHLARQVDRDARAPIDGRDLTTVLLEVGEIVKIGREANITYSGEDEEERASFSVDAPLNVAITRDDFTLEEHMRIQQRREAGGRR